MSERVDGSQPLEYAVPVRPREPLPVRIVFSILAVGFCGAGALCWGFGLFALVFVFVEVDYRGLRYVAGFWGVGTAIWWIGKKFEERAGSIRIR